MATTDNTRAGSGSATLRLVWEEHLKWGAMSARLKARQVKARNLAGVLGIGGAALAASAATLGAEAGWTRILAGAGAAAVLASTYLGREVVRSDEELLWTRARGLAEGLQRQVWLYLLRVPPYDADRPSVILEDRVTEMRADSGLSALDATGDERPTPPPEVESIGDYIEKRLKDQIRWYERRVREFSKKLELWKAVSLVLGLLATALGAAASFPAVVSLELEHWVPVLTTATAAIAAFLHAGRYAAFVGTYQETARRLRFRLARWEDLPDAEKTRDAEIRLVQDSESIMASENDAWSAEWQSGSSSPAGEG